MPAVDPLSATARPFVPHEFSSLDRLQRPAATALQKIDQNASSLCTPTGETSRLRVYKDALPPSSLYAPPYAHWRSSSSSSIDNIDRLNLESSPKRSTCEVGSDDWMSNEISRCLDTAKAELDIKYVAQQESR